MARKEDQRSRGQADTSAACPPTWVWSAQVSRDREWGEWGEEVRRGESRLRAPGPTRVQDVHIMHSGPCCGGGTDSGHVPMDPAATWLHPRVAAAEQVHRAAAGEHTSRVPALGEGLLLTNSPLPPLRYPAVCERPPVGSPHTPGHSACDKLPASTCAVVTELGYVCRANYATKH